MWNAIVLVSFSCEMLMHGTAFNPLTYSISFYSAIGQSQCLLLHTFESFSFFFSSFTRLNTHSNTTSVDIFSLHSLLFHGLAHRIVIHILHLDFLFCFYFCFWFWFLFYFLCSFHWNQNQFIFTITKFHILFCFHRICIPSWLPLVE